MAVAFSPSLLSLRLPDPRISIDFTNFAVDSDPLAASRKYLQSYRPTTHQPLKEKNRHTRPRAIVPVLPLREFREEPQTRDNQELLALSRKHRKAKQRDQSSSLKPAFLQSRSELGVSISSSTSTACTIVSPIFPRPPTVPASTSVNQGEPPVIFESQPKRKSSFFNMPQPVMDHILAYVIGGPWTISLGPQRAPNQRDQHLQHRAGLSHVDIRLIMMNPIFLVSQHLRKLFLIAFYRRSTFVIDLHHDSRTRCSADIDLEVCYKFWKNDTPSMVKNALGSVLNLQIRITVPSAETTAVRSAKYHNSIDEKAATISRVNVMQEEQQDVHALQECLSNITDLIVSSSNTLSRERSRSTSLGQPGTMRRMRSFRSVKQPPDTLEFICRGDTLTPRNRRQPLKRLEIILVKRRTTSVVLPETLELISTWSSIPVSGSTEYLIELEGRTRLWAVQRMGRWQGREPDGAKLLRDLQALQAAPLVAQTKSAKRFQFVKVRKGEHLTPHVLPQTAIMVEPPVVPSGQVKKLSKSNSRPKAQERIQSTAFASQKMRSRSEKEKRQLPEDGTFISDKGRMELESTIGGVMIRSTGEPPTVKELQRIAEDIRRGLY